MNATTVRILTRTDVASLALMDAIAPAVSASRSQPVPNDGWLLGV